MSKKYHSSVSAELARVQGDLKTMSPDELEKVYGIVVNENGSVYDDVATQSFKDTGAWLRFYGKCLQEEQQLEQMNDQWSEEYGDE